MDLAYATAADFRPFVDTAFEVRTLEGAATLTLAEVNEHAATDGGRTPFSLVFSSGAELDQGTYALQHSDLGSLEIFIVPMRPDHATGLNRYEAVFN